MNIASILYACNSIWYIPLYTVQVMHQTGGRAGPPPVKVNVPLMVPVPDIAPEPCQLHSMLKRGCQSGLAQSTSSW